MMLDPKGLEAAYDAGRDYVMEMDDRTKQMLRVSISAYLSTVTPAEVGGLVERLNIKAGVMEMGERIAWGSDTAIMREAATALEAQAAENEHKRAPAAEVDPDGMFERAYAEAAGVAHEASRPRAANPQTEARANLWVPAKPEHAKLGWTYDFEQTERISRAAYDSTGYEATMEVVEFVMAEADRRHRDALAAKDAELAKQIEVRDDAIDDLQQKWWFQSDRADRAEAQLAETNKALEDWWAGMRPSGWSRDQHAANPRVNLSRDGEKALADIAARRAREQGGENG